MKNDRKKLMDKLKRFGITDVPFNALLPELQDMWDNRGKLKQMQKPSKAPKSKESFPEFVQRKKTEIKEKLKKPKKKPRKYTNTKTTKDLGIKCPHCEYTDRRHGGTTHTYPNGNRRMKCGNSDCGKPFLVYAKF